jgi:arylsulfatase A-like enzyme
LERTSKVPFIWRGPGVANGKTTDTTVSLIDMYPTFVDLCSLPPVEGLEGKSIAGTLNNPDSAVDRNVLLPWMDPGTYAIINREYRYIHYAYGGEELYQVQKDPNEWYNLANDLKYTEIKTQLRNAAPTTFSKPCTKLNARRNLVLEGENYHWKANR